MKRPEFQSGDYETAIREAFYDEDRILLDKFLTEDDEPAVTGSTVALCFANLTKGMLVVGNLGDSHIVLAERDPVTDKPRNVVCRPYLFVLDLRLADSSGTSNASRKPINRAMLMKRRGSTKPEGPLTIARELHVLVSYHIIICATSS